MNIKPIRNEADYQAELLEIEPYFDNEPEPNTPESDRFEMLVTLIELYEAKHYHIDQPNPAEAMQSVVYEYSSAQARAGMAVGELKLTPVVSESVLKDLFKSSYN